MKKYIPLLIVYTVSLLTYFLDFNPWVTTICILFCTVYIFKNKTWLKAKNKADRFLTQLSVALFLLANVLFVFEDSAYIAAAIITPILGTISITWLLFSGFFRKKLGHTIEPEETAWGIYLSFLLCNVFTCLVL